jgi:hypothetical protein
VQISPFPPLTGDYNMGKENETCGTGCREKHHMIECPNCGLEYHIGVIHACPTSTFKFQHYY